MHPTERYQAQLEELYQLDTRFRHSRRNKAARSYLGALYIVTKKRRQRKHAQRRLRYTAALAILAVLTLGVTWLLVL